MLELGLDFQLKKQKEAIAAILSGKDVMIVLPTGYGKSLCYQCLPVVFNLKDSLPVSLKSVASCKAIIKDQVSHLALKEVIIYYCRCMHVRNMGWLLVFCVEIMMTM